MTRSVSLLKTLPVTSPIEAVEELMIRLDLPYDRPEQDELFAETSGNRSALRLWYRWEEGVNLLTFSCAMDGKTPANQRARIIPLLAAMNEKLWLGHFDLVSEDGTVVFRYSLMLREGEEPSLHLLDSLLETAVTECNRAYQAIQAMLWGGLSAEEALKAALFDTVGEA